MTARFYYLKKPRNPDCLQCGYNIIREEFFLNRDQPLSTLISALKMKGFHLDEEMEPIITVPDFDSLRMLNLEKSARNNKLHNLSLLTISGFEEGDIYATIKIMKKKKTPNK